MPDPQTPPLGCTIKVSVECVKFTDFGAVKNTEENTNCALGSQLYNLRKSLKNKMHQGEK